MGMKIKDANGADNMLMEIESGVIGLDTLLGMVTNAIEDLSVDAIYRLLEIAHRECTTILDNLIPVREYIDGKALEQIHKSINSRKQG